MEYGPDRFGWGLLSKMTEARPHRNFYGRRKGHNLRDSQEAYLEQDLAKLSPGAVDWDENPDRTALDLEALKDLVQVAVRMMDNVVDASRFPLEAQAREAQAKRRIGLGVTGLADALLMLGLRYGADDAVAQSEIWMKEIAHATYWASVELAREKGAFPLFDAEAFLVSGNMAQMDQDLREAIAKDGIRNALLTSIAPTGTISLYAGNVSSGIEPVFA